MEVCIVSQATGSHGWSSLEVYLHGFKALGYSVKLFNPKANWGDLDLIDDDGFFNYLSNNSSVPVVLCGFDWHSQPIHSSAKYKGLLRAHKGLRIGIFQEHISANWIKDDPNTLKLFRDALLASVECLTHVACNHEEDVEYIKCNGVTKPTLYLPFSFDESIFINNKKLHSRINKAYFRGKQFEFNGVSPYADRVRIFNFLKNHSNSVIKNLSEESMNDRLGMVSDYVETLNAYSLQLNLPSLSNSMTCRPFEIMSTGGLLFQSELDGEISNKILKQEHYISYSRKDPSSLKSLIDACQQDKSSIKIANAAYEYCIEFHGSKKRVKNLIDWASGSVSDLDFYNNLVNDKSSMIFNLNKMQKTEPKIFVDLVFYQYANTGIASVWNRLLNEWSKTNYAKYITLLVRSGATYSPPKEVLNKFNLISIRNHVPCSDEEFLGELCRDHHVTLFISTYFTTAKNIRSFLLIHDCIPERLNNNVMDEPDWIEKRSAINVANGYFCISKTTHADLVKYYGESTKGKLIYLTKNEIPYDFNRPDEQYIQEFKAKYNISKKYILFVGERVGYLGYKNVEKIARSLGLIASISPGLVNEYEILFLGGGDWGDELTIEPAIDKHLLAWKIKHLTISFSELAAAYSAASFLIYPSTIEGFGLPPGEAILCETPVLAFENEINREIYQDKIFYLKNGDDNELSKDLMRYLDSSYKIDCEHLKKIKSSFQDQKSDGGGSTQSGIMLELLLLNSQLDVDVSAENYEPILFDCQPSLRYGWLNDLIKFHPSCMNNDRKAYDIHTCAALVSIYNGAEFIKGCVSDLIDQTLFARGELQIILIDSNSPTDVYSLISSDVRRFSNIFYFRSVDRESLYRSWNRAARYSSAEFLSNSNLDDRHRIDFFEKMRNSLIENPEIQLVYPSQYLTSIANEPFYSHVPTRSWGWPEYSLNQLRIGNHIGSQPMWRSSLHHQIGYFNEKYRIAGDYDFWCRIAHDVGPLMLNPIHLGLFYFNPNGIEHGNPLQSEKEVTEICNKYGIEKNYRVSEDDILRGDSSTNAAAPRSIDDLQYSGVVISNKVNVILDKWANYSELDSVIQSIQSQDLTLDHSIYIYVIDDDSFHSIDNLLINKLTCQIKFVKLPDLFSVIAYPDSCTVLIRSFIPLDRGLLRQYISSLYSGELIFESHSGPNDQDLIIGRNCSFLGKFLD